MDFEAFRKEVLATYKVYTKLKNGDDRDPAAVMINLATSTICFNINYYTPTPRLVEFSYTVPLDLLLGTVEEMKKKIEEEKQERELFQKLKLKYDRTPNGGTIPMIGGGIWSPPSQELHYYC